MLPRAARTPQSLRRVGCVPPSSSTIVERRTARSVAARQPPAVLAIRRHASARESLGSAEEVDLLCQHAVARLSGLLQASVPSCSHCLCRCDNQYVFGRISSSTSSPYS